MSVFVISIVPVDGLATLDAKTSACVVMTKSGTGAERVKVDPH